MRLKNILLLATSATLVGCIGYVATHSGFGKKLAIVNEGVEEDEEGQDIQGAIESMYSMRLNEKTGTIEPEWVQAAIAQADKLKVSGRAVNLLWENMGPDNVGGRIRAFLLHRDSANLMFAGGVSGGLFRSNTFGQSWYPVNDWQENLNVNCIAQTQDGTIYYGTGEGGFTNLGGTRNGSPAFPGNGVYKSADNRGVKFNRLTSTNTSAFTICNAMVAHPTDNKLWVATESGLYMTSNGGTSFSVVKPGAFSDLAIDKNGTIWAVNWALGSGSCRIFKSDASGTTLTQITTVNTGGGRATIAISPEDPNYVYILGSTNTYAMAGFWRTTDGGQSWETLLSGTNSITDMFGGNNQGYYDNVIAVDPKYKNRCYLGGVALAVWDDIDGFREMASQFDAPWNNQYVHADKHVIQFNTRNNPPTMIVGCDGGLFFSENRTIWTPRNRGFTTLQLYNVAANSLGHMIGGAQDNGTQLINFTGNAWDNQLSKTAIEVYGGDGFDAEFSGIFPKTIFASTYFGTVARSSNEGQSISTFWDSRQDGKTKTDFNTTFTLWENWADSASILFLAKNSQIWAAINPTDFAKPVNWFLISNNLGGDRIIEMDHTPSGDHLFACKYGALYRIDNIQSANFSTTVYPNATDIPSPITTKNITPSGLGGRTITSVNVDQANENHVIITLGGYGNTSYVYETKNALDVVPLWSNITGDLPNIPVYDAVVDVDDPKHIILGTDLGVYVTSNGGTNWSEANNGMARVPVFEIRGYEFHPWEGMALYIGTHGRGYFRSLSLTTGTKKITKTDGIKLNAYPNPSTSLVNVEFSAAYNGPVTLEIFGMNGQRYIESKQTCNRGVNTMPVNVSNLSNGYYFARVTMGSNSSTVKFAVNK